MKPILILSSYNQDILKPCFAIGTTLKAMELVVLLWCREVFWHGPCTFGKTESPILDSDVALLAPVFTPRIAHNPIESFLCVSSPPNHRDDMVDTLTLRCDNTSGVVVQ